MLVAALARPNSLAQLSVGFVALMSTDPSEVDTSESDSSKGADGAVTAENSETETETESGGDAASGFGSVAPFAFECEFVFAVVSTALASGDSMRILSAGVLGSVVPVVVGLRGCGSAERARSAWLVASTG